MVALASHLYIFGGWDRVAGVIPLSIKSLHI